MKMQSSDLVDQAAQLLGDPNLSTPEVIEQIANAAERDVDLVNQALELAQQRVTASGDTADATAQILTRVRQQLQD